MKSFLIKPGSALLVFSLIYFGNRFVQSYLGEQARANIPIEVHTLQVGLDQAKAHNKLIIADYSAIWCPSCRKLDSQIYADLKVAETIDSHFVLVKIEHDSAQGEMFAKQYGLTGFPRVLVFDQDGQRMTEMPLTFDAQAYNANLQKVVHAYSRPVADITGN
ncbi:thioredoxin family protein [Glaciecola sp. XM2]|uniref:thioredoxin family protein n=1 Tax=Glaciecola sp. XM2 TaxID=1914931 RepID=UPI001BDE31F4|nr:thioredoxin family protein [Glaciecola sp. XM2]MBT1452245.1 thioredoxin family protein [Glaciecola sp. XM2]